MLNSNDSNVLFPVACKGQPNKACSESGRRVPHLEKGGRGLFDLFFPLYAPWSCSGDLYCLVTLSGIRLGKLARWRLRNREHNRENGNISSTHYWALDEQVLLLPRKLTDFLEKDGYGEVRS